MKCLLSMVALLASTAAAAEPLEFHNGRLFIGAQLNGVATEALLDSGAEASLIDEEFARRAGLGAGTPMTIRGSGGEQQARVVPGVAVEALGLKLQPELVVVMDLEDISQRLIRRPTAMVVGRELFDAGRLRIDIAGSSIDLVSRTTVPPGERLPLIPHAGIESIPVVAGGLEVQAEFDLGNGSEVMVSRALANRLKLKLHGKKAGGGIGGEIMRDRVTLDRLEVAGRIFHDVPAVIDDQPSGNDLNIGTSILKHFLITTDFEQRAVWLADTEEVH